MEKVIVGKYTLESLTTGMYVNPLILYREYIQNSTDSIDEAIENKIINKHSSYIDISINEECKEIIIEDNGVGISSNKALKILTDIGNSQKRYSNNKGFRGIGRLSGLSYCETLIFETSKLGENKKSKISFDAKKLDELLIPGKYEEYGVSEVIENIIDVEYTEEEVGKHYFKVILKNVNAKLNLLDIKKVKTYLQEVAPVPFDIKKFKFAEEINNRLLECDGTLDEYNIFVTYKERKEQIFKPYKRRIYADIKKKLNDEITDVEIKLIKDDAKNKNVALVWHGKSQMLGTLIDDSIKGLRVRKSGILIGDRFLANEIFKEDRFNGWIIGEVIVLDNDIIPNARRDDFEKNNAYLFLFKELRKIGMKISDEIRNASKKRNLEPKESRIDDKIKCGYIKEDDKYTNNKNEALITKVDLLIDRIKRKDEKINNIKNILEENNISESIINDIIMQLID